MRAPLGYGKHFLLVTAVAALIVSAFAVYNADYLFHTRLYEAGDPGANSLSVLRAKRFHEIYGPYSRWGFHHPGPAIFYFSALMEAIFYSGLHLVPTGYNAQALGTIILSVGFLVAGIGIAARWVRNPFFVPLAFGLGTLHFTAVSAPALFTSTWPACVVPMIFFCLLMATASVAAGEGRDLPILMLAGSLTMHIHVAQPLFVLPMFTLGYLGLCWSCRRAAREASFTGQTPRSALPWRQFPRAHLIAGIIAAALGLPLLVDLFRGESNFGLILEHMRRKHEQPHAWLDAILYFLRFGYYKMDINTILPGGTQVVTITRYLARHLPMTLAWLTGLLLPVLALGLRRSRRGAADVVDGMAPRALQGRFLASLCCVWVVGAGLTVVWAHIQDGVMFFYNAWFTHATYYVLALIAAISFGDILETLVAHRAWRTALAVAVGAACLAGGAMVCGRNKAQFRCSDFSGGPAVAQARTVLAALAEHADAPRTKLLLFPDAPGWGAATGVAVLLERLGYDPRVVSDWRIMFGENIALPRSLPALKENFFRGSVEIWHILPGQTHPQLYAAHPLVDGYALEAGGLVEVDPTIGADIEFAGPRPNAENFEILGWSAPDKPTDTFVWTVGKFSVMNFRVKPIPAGASVEMVYDAFLFGAEKNPTPQRVTFYWNGTDVGTFSVTGRGPLQVTIPAALWNAKHDVFLQLSLPDAISPRQLEEGDDDRQFALGSERITFRIVGTSR